MQDLSMTILELMEYLPGVVFGLEPGNGYGLRFVSESVWGLLAYNKEQFISDPAFWLDLVHPADRRRVAEGLDSILETQVLSQEYRLVHREGHSLWVQAEMKLITDPRGQALGIIGLWNDVSERRCLQENLRESEERWKYALEGSGQGVWDWNMVTDEVFFSSSWKSMLGFADDGITGHISEWDKRVHPDDRMEVRGRLEGHLNGNTPGYICEHRVLCKDGSFKWVLDKGKIIKRDEQGRPLRMIGTHTDISRYRKVEQDLRASEERFMKAFQLSPALTAITSLADGTYLEVNDAFLNTMGFKRDEVLGRRPNDINLTIEFQESGNSLKEVLPEGSIRNKEITFKDMHGKTHTGLFSATAVVIDGKDCLLSVALDITKRKKYEKQISYQAYHDLLTRLPNRRFFEERLRYVIADARRRQEKVAVLFLDLDGFKQVNDTLGHEAGDKVLRDTAAHLTRCLRETDTVARLGGDEFMIIIPHIQDHDEIRPIIERILNTCRRNVGTISISVSIGAAFYPENGTRVSTLMKNADIAMYRAKDAGRDQAAYF